MEHRLELKLLQKLILTPQLQQAIKLLQLPQIELSQTLQNELVENPFLEETVVELSPEEAKSQEADEAEREDHDMELPVGEQADFAVDDYFDTRSFDGRDLGYFSPDVTTSQTLEHYVSEGTDLYDHLTWQLRFSDASDEVREAAEVVIGNIEENGYLKATEEEIAQYAGCSAETAREAISLVQTFDPVGVGARDLKECLLLQLPPLNLEGTLVEDLIGNHLEDIEKRKFQQLATRFGCTLEEIKEAVKVISDLEPKPGRGYSAVQPIYIKPDVYVVRADGDFQIILNDENMPNLRINSYYRKLLMAKDALKKDEKAYLEERLRSAVWLLKSLDHRNKTIYRVTESILKFQREFFENGVSHLKPLNLKDVASDLGMHESTISRTTSNKYLSCGHGLFNFRYFFSSGLKTASGSVSSTSVKDMIKKLVDEENPRKPLSDQKISEMLKSLNIKVARRTVAKYREEMNIPPQNIRKRIE
ncbi:MAG: RNA polymerase factor sigma-54 [Nitrospirota bacterium]|jgi:RNA polymerase sigma-54 factor